MPRRASPTDEASAWPGDYSPDGQLSFHHFAKEKPSAGSASRCRVRDLSLAHHGKVYAQSSDRQGPNSPQIVIQQHVRKTLRSCGDLSRCQSCLWGRRGLGGVDPQGIGPVWRAKPLFSKDLGRIPVGNFFSARWGFPRLWRTGCPGPESPRTGLDAAAESGRRFRARLAFHSNMWWVKLLYTQDSG